jgi:hypothetical protein
MLLYAIAPRDERDGGCADPGRLQDPSGAGKRRDVKVFMHLLALEIARAAELFSQVAAYGGSAPWSRSIRAIPSLYRRMNRSSYDPPAGARIPA